MKMYQKVGIPIIILSLICGINMLFLYERALQHGDTSLFYQEKIQQLFEKAIQDDLEERAKSFPRLFVAQPGNSSSKEKTIMCMKNPKLNKYQNTLFNY
ncbi:hypothetical protein M2480_001459 [Parabacteroides sp. PFB2-12]|uniref:hypothetical protein n=1 Tax=unclassified Parabacteroides TaxID=2649774 RepID=UPI002476E7D4|nr:MULTISPECIES: hypothetical protein [unclassified Parabacteroides]MDH6342886.1 hypothetical protein [Parabacteroides sp. PM6-13]MDH6390484.1 hypothetical protein [Parabacteroides sp. PFB2-12]